MVVLGHGPVMWDERLGFPTLKDRTLVLRFARLNKTLTDHSRLTCCATTANVPELES